MALFGGGNLSVPTGGQKSIYEVIFMLKQQLVNLLNQFGVSVVFNEYVEGEPQFDVLKMKLFIGHGIHNDDIINIYLAKAVGYCLELQHRFHGDQEAMIKHWFLKGGDIEDKAWDYAQQILSHYKYDKWGLFVQVKCMSLRFQALSSEENYLLEEYYEFGDEGIRRKLDEIDWLREAFIDFLKNPRF